MNPASLLKLMNERKGFEKRHPMLIRFFNKEILRGVPEGSVLELTLKRPGEDPITTNMSVKAEDLKMFESLKDLK